MITIATPTGNIGRQLVELLVAAGEHITLVSRSPEKLSASLRHREIARQASADDAPALARALEGTDVLFWVTPSNPGAPDVRGWYRKVADAVSRAVRANGITRVVNISSAGAQRPDGLGPISGLREVEMALNDAAPNVYHLRPGFFMENFLSQLGTMRREGKLYWLYPGHFALSMVATRDIAEVAAARLVDFGWSGRKIQGLHGPADVSFEIATEILALVVGRPLRHIQLKPDEFRRLARDRGASSEFADSHVAMCESLRKLGWDRVAELRTPETTTRTTLGEWACETLVPLVHAR